MNHTRGKREQRRINLRQHSGGESESAQQRLWEWERVKSEGGVWCSYIQSHGLFGPGLLHLVVHDGVIDAQPAKDDKRLGREQQAAWVNTGEGPFGAAAALTQRRGGYLEKALVRVIKRFPVQSVQHLGNTCESSQNTVQT